MPNQIKGSKVYINSSKNIIQLVFAIVIVSCGGGSDDRPGDLVLMEKAMNEVFYTCPERIWPGVQSEYENLQVIINDLNTHRAWIWNDQSTDSIHPPKLIELDYQELTSREWFAPFTVSSFNGYKTFGITMNSRYSNYESAGTIWASSELRYIFHESFHFVVQRKVEWQHVFGNRNQSFPDQSEARYLRQEMITDLTRLFLEGSNLAAPAFWFDRYKTEFPEEFNRFREVNRTEGTAEFGELLMFAIADQGCGASQVQLMNVIKSKLKYLSNREPYQIGSLASFILTDRNIDFWENEVETGTPPLEILLKDVVPQPQEENAELKETIENDTEQKNQELAVKITPLLEAFDDSINYIKIVLQTQDLQGAYRASSYVPTERTEFDSIKLKVRAVFGSNGEVTVNGADILTKKQFSSLDPIVLLEQTPCGPFYSWIIVVPNTAVNIHSSEMVSVESESLNFKNLPVTIENTQEGTWVCLAQIDS